MLRALGQFALLSPIPWGKKFWSKNCQNLVIFVISHNFSVILWTIPNSQLIVLVKQTKQEIVDIERVMF